MIINHKKTKYSLDIDKAIQLGVMTKIPKMRKIKACDIPKYALFRWAYTHIPNIYYNYVMIDSYLRDRGQIVSTETGGFGWIDFDDESIICEFFDIKKQKWIREIEID